MNNPIQSIIPPVTIQHQLSRHCSSSVGIIRKGRKSAIFTRCVCCNSQITGIIISEANCVIPCFPVRNIAACNVGLWLADSG